MPKSDLKPVHWIASSHEDLRAFPEAVQRAMGYALLRAQEGKKSPQARRYDGGLETVEYRDADTFRIVYTVEFAGTVYVLHAFQRKAGRSTPPPRHKVDLLRVRDELTKEFNHHMEVLGARHELAKAHYDQSRRRE